MKDKFNNYFKYIRESGRRQSRVSDSLLTQKYKLPALEVLKYQCARGKKSRYLSKIWSFDLHISKAEKLLQLTSNCRDCKKDIYRTKTRKMEKDVIFL